jgi:transposase-like protein
MRLQLGNTWKGKYRCAEKDCSKYFSVTVGTVFERSYIPLHKWLLAAYLLCSFEKRMSSYRSHDSLDITHRSACSLHTVSARQCAAARSEPSAASPGPRNAIISPLPPP